MREVDVGAHVPERASGSALGALWPFAVIAVLLGVIGYLWMSRPIPAPSAADSSVEPVPTPIPLTDEVTAALDAASSSEPESASSTVAPPQPQIIRIEVPASPQQQAPTHSAASQVQTEEELRRRQEMAESQQRQRWHIETARVTYELQKAVAAYRLQICTEARGGLPISTTRDSRGEYVDARAAAQALEESGRVAGIPPGWVRINWGEFPDPEEPTSSYKAAELARKWNCGNVSTRGF